jgi:hypothetical protein
LSVGIKVKLCEWGSGCRNKLSVTQRGRVLNRHPASIFLGLLQIFLSVTILTLPLTKLGVQDGEFMGSDSFFHALDLPILGVGPG